MLWFVHFTSGAQDSYDTMSEKEASSSSEGFEGSLNYNGHKLTSRKFRNGMEVVRYATRLLKQDNLPEAVRIRLRQFIDRYYNRTGFILDAFDKKYDAKKAS